jgi:hypothetical protein
MYSVVMASSAAVETYGATDPSLVAMTTLWTLGSTQPIKWFDKDGHYTGDQPMPPPHAYRGVPEGATAAVREQVRLGDAVQPTLFDDHHRGTQQ